MLNHTGSSSMAQVVEVAVGDGAQVSVVSLQDWADDAVHLTHHQAKVGRDARYKHVAVSFGGDVVRMDANVEYDGPGGEAELLGLYFADAGQHIEHRLFADHTAPRTKSNVLYKGALQGQGAHTVWIGNVLIRKVAEGIETYEENRNLVLTDGCQADSVPNLEIETGEIEGAGHASATGRFDDEQLFYLQSRGIPEDEAHRLVVHGFFADIVRQIDVPQIEERLLSTIEAELEKNVGGPGEPLMAFTRACALERPDPRRAARGRRRRRRGGRRPSRRRGLRHPRRVLARRDPALRGRGRGLRDRVLAARLALRPAHREAERPAGDRAGADLPRAGRRRRRPGRRHRPLND